MTSLPQSTETDIPNHPPLPGLAEIEAAAGRLRGHAVVTPLLEPPALALETGARVLVKPEPLQRTGSFKFRGAYNKISQIPPGRRAAGVVAYSSGNHAQGVAAAAELLGVPATIVMPADAPAIKIENTRSYGADVVLYARDGEPREAVAARLLAERPATLVRPYDDPDIIAGQGTCGLEIARQAEALGAELDAVLICCGGGGLTAGCATALSALVPGAALHTVEPAGFDDTARSLVAGERLANAPGATSFCDALLSPKPGALTFQVNRRLITSGLVVDDDQVARAMAFAFRTLKLVVEPGGAVALAALLEGKLEVEGKTVAVVLSGGNVDPETFAAALRQSDDLTRS